MIEKAHFHPIGAGTSSYVLGDRLTLKGHVPGTDLYLAEVIVPPGSGVPPHTHPSPETFVLASGRLGFVLNDGESVEAAAGDIITVPSNAWHGYQNLGAEHARVFVMFDESLKRFFEAIGSPTPLPAGRPDKARIDAVFSIARAMGMQIRA